MKPVEIGGKKQLTVEQTKYMIHYRGNPGREAELIRDLLKEDWTQREIAEELHVTQPQVSRRLSLLELPERVFKKLVEGNLKPSVAYELAKLPKDKIEELTKDGKVPPTLKSIAAVRRDGVISDKLMEMLVSNVGNVSPVDRARKHGFDVVLDSQRLGDIDSRFRGSLSGIDLQQITCPNCQHHFSVAVKKQ